MNPRGGARLVSLPVTCRARGHNTAGRVHDLTREGCLLDLGNGFIVAGDGVALRFANGVRLNGRVTLLHGRIARVEFEQPLHEAIHTHLLNSGETTAAPAGRSFDHPRRVASGARRLG
jgi:hypothetical protein